MLSKVVKSGIVFYSVADLNKILREPSPVMLAEKAIKANGLKEKDDFIKKGNKNDYYMTVGSLWKLTKPFKKKLNGMMAERALKELDVPKESPDKEPSKDDNKKDYSRRLTNANTYKISHHAQTRLRQRFNIPNNQQDNWFATMAPRLGYIGTQYGETQEVWGNDDVTIVTSPSEKTVVTVLEPDMEVHISNTSYEDIDEKFDQAIRSMELKENRGYWEDLSSCLSQFAKFANAAVESIDSTKNAKAARGLEIMADTEKTVIEQYRKLVYDLDSTISEHNERMKYIESKR